jgi:hypothetical protein
MQRYLVLYCLVGFLGALTTRLLFVFVLRGHFGAFALVSTVAERLLLSPSHAFPHDVLLRFAVTCCDYIARFVVRRIVGF